MEVAHFSSLTALPAFSNFPSIRLNLRCQFQVLPASRPVWICSFIRLSSNRESRRGEFRSRLRRYYL